MDFEDPPPRLRHIAKAFEAEMTDWAESANVIGFDHEVGNDGVHYVGFWSITVTEMAEQTQEHIDRGWLYARYMDDARAYSMLRETEDGGWEPYVAVTGRVRVPLTMIETTVRIS